ncbi:leucyl-tRNA synthetase, partial [Streptomyces nanshensis]
DQRDFEFARAFELPMRCVVEPTDGRGTDPADWQEAFSSYEAALVNSRAEGISLDGLGVGEAKERMRRWLEQHGLGEGTVNYRLRDWLFSRQRYWGEPFPIVYDEDGIAHGLPESMLPLELPEVEDYSPRTFDPPRAARVDAAAGAAGGRGLLPAHLRPGRRGHLSGDPAVPERGVDPRHPGPG